VSADSDGDGRGGRTRAKNKSEVPHRTRPRLAARYPVHVTARIQKGLPSIRRKQEYMALFRAFEAARHRNGLRLVHYSVQGNHVHLVAEAKDAGCLARGMQGLTIRMAKRLNKLWKRTGKVFADRYHAHILKTPTEVRNVLDYVFHNARKHKRRPSEDLDPFSSARWFDGWSDRGVCDRYLNPLSVARTWLLSTGWRRRGLLTPQPSG